MTRYEQGFLNKCAEHGLDTGTALGLMEKKAVPLQTAKAVARGLKSGKYTLRPLPRKPGTWGNYGWGTSLKGSRTAVTEWIRSLLSRGGAENLSEPELAKLKTLFAPADPIHEVLKKNRTAPANKYSDRIKALLTLFGENGADRPLRFADDVISAGDVGKATRNIANRSKRELSILGEGNDSAKTLIDALYRG